MRRVFLLTGNLLPILAVLLLLLPCPVQAGEGKLVPVSPRDKCPVCGMFVARYPDFLARIDFRDGSYAVFDGIKDLLKYWLNMEKYERKKRAADIVSILVTDYYRLAPIDGLGAWYVKGSDVYGPMGRELIPFASEEEAREFMKDHKGESVLRFRQITAELIKTLD